MPHEFTLTIIGNSPQQIVVPTGRYSIGRSDDNDLVIGSSSVSRRHAVITNYDDGAQITDCGSQNGTFVNGRQIDAAVQLKDGDLISIGSICELRVELRRQGDAGGRSTYLRPPGARHETTFWQPPQSSDAAPSQFDTPKIALIIIVAIIIILALTVLVLKSGGGGRGEYIPPSPTVTSTPEIATPLGPCEGLTLESIEAAAEQVIGRVSNDANRYVFPSDRNHLGRIKTVVENNCRSSALGAALQRLRNARPQLAVWSNNQIGPELLEYATLAETDGQSSDLLATARRIAPQLIAVSILLRDRNAESTLLMLAAFRMGPPARNSHPILERMRAAGIDQQTERNVWDLYRKGILTDIEYDFVIRFLAFGIIAYEPKRFGIDLALESPVDRTAMTCNTCQ